MESGSLARLAQTTQLHQEKKSDRVGGGGGSWRGVEEGDETKPHLE